MVAMVDCVAARLAPERADELTCPAADAAHRLAHRLETGAEIGVAELDRQHRVLQRREGAVGARDRIHGGVDQVPGVLGGRSGGSRFELAALELVAGGEVAVGPLNAPVGRLYGPE